MVKLRQTKRDHSVFYSKENSVHIFLCLQVSVFEAKIRDHSPVSGIPNVKKNQPFCPPAISLLF